MKIIIEIPDQFYQTYAKNAKSLVPNVALVQAAGEAVYRELNVYAAVYHKDIIVTCELPTDK